MLLISFISCENNEDRVWAVSNYPGLCDFCEHIALTIIYVIYVNLGYCVIL
jgi:hypothetical protein